MRICVHVQQEKNTLGAKRPPLLGAKRPCSWAFYPTVLSVGIVPQTCDYCGDGYLKINEYQWHRNADNLVTNNNRILGQYMWYNSGNLRAMFLKYGVKNRGVRRPRAHCPALYCLASQQTAVYTLNLAYLRIMVTIEMFISQWIRLRKCFRIKTVGSFPLTFGSQWCIWHIPQVMTLPIFPCI